MWAPCRTLSPFAALGGTLAPSLAFPRNEGVPGSSPGVGSKERPAHAGFFFFRSGERCEVVQT